MDALRRSAGISRKERTRNEEVNGKTGIQDTLTREIERRQITWYGQIKTMTDDRLPKVAMHRIPGQRRGRARRKKNSLSGIRKTMSDRILIEGQCENGQEWDFSYLNRKLLFNHSYVFLFYNIKIKLW